MLTILGDIAKGFAQGLGYVFYSNVIRANSQENIEQKKKEKMKKQLKKYLSYMNKKI